MVLRQPSTVSPTCSSRAAPSTNSSASHACKSTSNELRPCRGNGNFNEPNECGRIFCLPHCWQVKVVVRVPWNTCMVVPVGLHASSSAMHASCASCCELFRNPAFQSPCRRTMVGTKGAHSDGDGITTKSHTITQAQHGVP